MQERVLAKLEMLTEIGQPDVAALANAMIEFITDKPHKPIGFRTNEEKDNNGG
jgi:hypothetical protein